MSGRREFSHRQSRVQRVRKSPSCVYIPCVHLLQKEVRRITCLWWPYTKMTSKNSLAACLIMWEGRGQAPYRRACSYSRRWGQHASLSPQRLKGGHFSCAWVGGFFLPPLPPSLAVWMFQDILPHPHSFINSPLCQTELASCDTCHKVSQADRQSLRRGYCSAIEHISDWHTDSSWWERAILPHP